MNLNRSPVPKQFLLTAIFQVLFVSALFAQVPQEDVIYLNNGTYLRGKIVEMVPGKSLKLALNGSRDTLSIGMDDVKMIRKEETAAYSIASEAGKKPWEYTFIAELNFGVGEVVYYGGSADSRTGQYTVMLDVINGFSITPHLQAGVGIGLDLWRTMKFMPVYLDIRSSLGKHASSPFIYFDGGYSFGWMYSEGNVNYGGLMAGIGMGGRFRAGRKQFMFFSLGYKLQQTTGQWDGDHSKETLNGNFVVFKAGIML
jgi:hypothetical protein